MRAAHGLLSLFLLYHTNSRVINGWIITYPLSSLYDHLEITIYKCRHCVHVSENVHVGPSHNTALSGINRADCCCMWLCVLSGSVATAEDPAAIATIQSATTFADQPIRYLFKTEGAGGQVGGRTVTWLLRYR